MGARPKLTQQRRVQTLEAAVEVISERGLCDTRIADIAKRAGLSPALLLYYFGSKERLLTEALTYAEDRFYLTTFHELTGIESATQRLVKLIELATPPDREYTETVGDWSLWIELWGRSLRDPEAADKREALDRRWRNTIADIVRAGHKTGEFGPCDADDFALRLAALIDGLALQILLKDSEVSSERMLRLCIEAAAQELGFAAELDGKRSSA